MRRRIISIVICLAIFGGAITLSAPTIALAQRSNPDGWDLMATGAAFYSQKMADLGKFREIKVAVIDTGFSSDAPIFSGRMIQGYNTAAKTYDTTDIDGHGTAMASVVAYTTWHNPNIKIMPLKIDRGGDIQSAPFAEAVEHATRAGVDVISISIAANLKQGDSFVWGIERAIREAIAAGITVVVASGNDNQDVSGWSPARMDEVICVGSIGENKRISSFSNWGSTLDFVAPGEGILTRRPTNDYVESGTSPAAAHVAGICALLKLNFPSAKPQHLHRILKEYAEDLGENGWDRFYGWGLPNLALTPADTSKGSADINNYLDMRTHWSRVAVDYLVERQIVNGYAYIDNLYEFMPQNNITRAEFAALLARASGDSVGGRNAVFSDVRAHEWYAQAAFWAFECGVVTGYEDGSFRPSQNISRQEMAAMLVRYADYKGKFMARTGYLELLNDDWQIADWAREYMHILQRAGIIKGDDGRNGNPRANATRAESATMLFNTISD
ncbi:MAG: S8 family serine peptidase [Oscillospiraceae bacterium]|nr:S8 family serine peptidase [Oscillospiraceae bacterium]